MYEDFFGLARRPFVAAPSADRYFPAPSLEAARTTLARCIERSEGAGLLVGPSGTGKTLLLEVLAKQFRDAFQVALLVSGQLTTRRALLQVILFELGLPYRHHEEGELRLALIDHLARGEDCPAGVLLLVDEAHTLPVRLLEEVRMITNVVRHGESRVRLVLAGAPSIEERLASPRLDSLNQRLAARCYIDSLGSAETSDYLRHQIGLAGGDTGQVFGPSALEAVFRATDGIPRLVNQVCDHALMLAFTDGVRPLDAGVVERAWADLQQLPTPWGVTARPQAAQSAAAAHPQVIEFGGLDEEPTTMQSELESSPEADADLDEEFLPTSSTLDPDVEMLLDEEPAAAETVVAESPAAEGYGFTDQPVVEEGGFAYQTVATELGFTDQPADAEADADFANASAVGDAEFADEMAVEEPTLVDEPAVAQESLPAELTEDEPAFAAEPVAAEPAFVDEPAYAAAGMEQAATFDPYATEVTPEDWTVSPVLESEAAQEEVVVDLYATLDAQKERAGMHGGGHTPGGPDWLEGLPRVINRSPEEMLTLAEALLRHEGAAEPPADMPEANAAAEPAPVADSTEPQEAGPPDCCESRSLAASATNSVEVPCHEQAETLEGMTVVAALGGPLLSANGQSQGPFAEESPREEDLIVVEGRGEESPVPAQTEQPVRRQEYRQLFARLRRGGS